LRQAGSIETPVTQAVIDDPGSDAGIKTMAPVHRWGYAAEMAEVNLFLASSAASFAAGADLASVAERHVIDFETKAKQRKPSCNQ
jgi:NAD(P)-dependent dehydrogenase (short-subunit alcohol dehydrogenase family)